MKVMVIWQNIPDSTDIFILEGEHAEVALNCHNLYVNSDEHPALDQLSEILVGQHKLDTVSPLNNNGVDKIVLTGMFI